MNSTSHGPFPEETRWSRLQADGSKANRAWNYFYTHYRGAVAILFRRLGLPPGFRNADLEDLVQDFFIRSFEGGMLQSADPERGRFRCYLKTVARGYLIDRKRKAGSQKRRPEGGIAPLDLLPNDPAGSNLSPEEAFDRAWTAALLAAATGRLEAELASEDSPDAEIYALRSREELPWKEIVERLGIPEPTLRRRYRKVRDRLAQYVRQEVTETVSGAEALERELTELGTIFATESP